MTRHVLDIALEHCIQGRHDESEALLRSADQDDPRVLFNLGWHAYRRGEWEKGAELQDNGRWINVIGSPPLGAGTPIWDGTPLYGKTVLLRLEGGFGDEIIGLRWVPHIMKAAQTDRVIVACHRDLRQVFQDRSFPPRRAVSYVSNEGAAHVLHDVWIPAMSATRWFPPTGERYLRRFKLSVPPRLSSKRRKIGIRWSGNPEFEHQQHRRFPPELMIALSDTPNTEFYSFQRDTDLRPLPQNVTDMASELTTWSRTFAGLAEMDLVISSCTSIAHAAAAMGVETWVVVPVLPYSIWAMPGTRSPWYNSATVYRQEVYGDWAAPFDKIRQDLMKYANP